MWHFIKRNASDGGKDITDLKSVTYLTSWFFQGYVAFLQLKDHFNYKSFICRPGSVIAIVQMQFPRGISDPLQPLRSEMNDGRLGIFTVDRELHINRSLYIDLCD